MVAGCQEDHFGWWGSYSPGSNELPRPDSWSWAPSLKWSPAPSLDPETFPLHSPGTQTPPSASKEAWLTLLQQTELSTRNQKPLSWFSLFFFFLSVLGCHKSSQVHFYNLWMGMKSYPAYLFSLLLGIKSKNACKRTSESMAGWINVKHAHFDYYSCLLLLCLDECPFPRQRILFFFNIAFIYFTQRYHK